MKKRVLMIGHTYAAPVNRRKLEHMARDARFEFMLVAPSRWHNDLTIADNSRERETSSYSARFLRARPVEHPALHVLPGLGKVARDFQPDLIYCEQEPICLVSMQAAKAASGRPFVLYTWENVDRHDLAYACLSPVRKFCLSRANCVVAGSTAAAKVIRNHGYRRKIYISPLLGVDLKLFSPGTKIGTCDSRPRTIGFIGRFSTEKDVPTLLRSVAGLNGRADWRLVMLGAGEEKEKSLQLARNLKIIDRVSVRPSVSHDEVPKTIRSFDLLVLPSRTTRRWKEQFGHVLIEAMACGVPVIGSSSGEIPAVIGDAGLVFEEGNTADLSDKIVRLFEDSALCESLRANGLKRVAERFSDECIARNSLAVCEIVLGMQRSTPNTLEEAP